MPLKFSDNGQGNAYQVYLLSVNIWRCNCSDRGSNLALSCHTDQCSYRKFIMKEVSGTKSQQNK